MMLPLLVAQSCTSQAQEDFIKARLTHCYVMQFSLLRNDIDDLRHHVVHTLRGDGQMGPVLFDLFDSY